LKAYVLIQTEAGAGPLVRRLLAIPGVVAAEDLSGAFDAIALATSRSTRQLIDDVIGKIRTLPGVTRALPTPVVDTLTEHPAAASSLRLPRSHDAAA
jgi:hypothetical protein